MAESHGTAGHGSPDDEYRATPPGAGYEHTDASVGIIVKFMLWLLVAAVVIHVGMWGMFALLVEQRRETADPQFPLAVGLEDRRPPEPRLQQFPQMEYRDFRLQEDALLHHYGWIDRAAGTVRIPIDDAMRIVIERGLPSREPVETEPHAVPGMTPSDASSGRTMVRRR